MKILTYLTWACGIVGALLILAGCIGYLVGGKFLGVNHALNFFHVANSILILAILSKLMSPCCEKTEK